MAEKRPIGFTGASAVAEDDYFLIDGQTNGTRKIKASFVADAISANVDNTLAVSGKAADAKKTGDEFSDLKSALSETQLLSFVDPITISGLKNTSNWVVGQGISVADGAGMDNTKYCRTTYLGFSKPFLIYIDNSNYEFNVWEYSSASWASSTYSPKAEYSDDPAILNQYQSSVYFRIGARRKDGSDITSSDITAITSAITPLVIPYPFMRLTLDVNDCAEIANSTDYNTLQTVGNYFVASGANASSMTNCPTAKAHRLSVMSSYSTNRYIQIIQDANDIFIRGYGGAWSTWKRLLGDIDYPIFVSPTPLPSCDLDTVYKKNIVYILDSENTYHNVPENLTTGILQVLTSANWTFQIFYTWTTGKMFTRRINPSGVVTSWVAVSGGAIENVYNNTYNITTSPTITTDTNGWLQAVDTDTSDETSKTDMTGAIMSMLTDTGYCHLGEGIFYVSGSIDMPPNSTLCGCGDKTQIRLLQSVTSGYCVKLQEYCTIKDVSFSGSRTALSPTTSGTRDGIHFVAGYESTPQTKTTHCVIDNVIIRDFNGSGLYCNETSASPEEGLYVNNLFVTGCYIGINISTYSEFHKFTNVCTSRTCYYGIINNGGNNAFTACTIGASNTGFYVDGSYPNSAHGVLNGCEFAHIGSNEGKALDFNGITTAGFLINNCRFGYCSIHLTNSSGVCFNGCQFIRGTLTDDDLIIINGGNLVSFDGCLFNEESPSIDITNNSKVKFNACYTLASGSVVSAS